MSDDKINQVRPEDMKEISEIMLQLTGVQFLDKQSGMIQSRLFKRMIELGLKEIKDYLTYLKDNFSTESKILVSLLTTHHTFFFREFYHFEFLLKEGLRQVIDDVRAQKQNKIRIWSAACSQGQEVYSLALFLDYHLAMMAPDLSYEILGTDIDIDCIKLAKNGVYRFEQIKEIPTIYSANHWQKGTGDIANYVRIKEPIKQRCQFVTSNLFDMNLLMGQTFHLIFCRNVFIYFSPEQISNVSKNLLQLLSPKGYLFLGLSETLNGITLPIEQVGASVYVKKAQKKTLGHKGFEGNAAPAANSPALVPEVVNALTEPAAVMSSPDEKKKIRVLCVDDSPVILSLLKKIFTAEYNFVVVGTAVNGEDAHEMVKKFSPDIITLDIHMPELNGVEYLRKYYNEFHPPVVMVSSVSREDMEFGIQSLELGAMDFIEKPSLATLNDKADELRTKLRCAVEYKEQRHQQEAQLQLVKSFQKEFHSVGPVDCIRVCVGGLGDLQKIKSMISSSSNLHSAVVILLHGADSFLSLLIDKTQIPGKGVYAVDKTSVFMPGNVYIGTFESYDKVQKIIDQKMTQHLFVLGDTPDMVVLKLLPSIANRALYLEEVSVLQGKSNYRKLKKIAKEICPYMSLFYHSNRQMFLDKKKAAA